MSNPLRYQHLSKLRMARLGGGTEWTPRYDTENYGRWSLDSYCIAAVVVLSVHSNSLVSPVSWCQVRPSVRSSVTAPQCSQDAPDIPHLPLTPFTPFTTHTEYSSASARVSRMQILWNLDVLGTLALWALFAQPRQTRHLT